MSPSATYRWNAARVGVGSVPLKPPIAITGSSLASWYPAACSEPTVASTHRYRSACAWRSATRSALGLLAVSKPPLPRPRGGPLVPPGRPNAPGLTGPLPLAFADAGPVRALREFGEGALPPTRPLRKFGRG